VCYQRERNAVIVSTWDRVVVLVFRTMAHAGLLPVAHERPVAAVVREPPVVAVAHGRPAAVARGRPSPAAAYERPEAAAHGRPAAAHERSALLAKVRERAAAARWVEPLGLWKAD
jgi:hypothetical protein